MAQMLDQNSSSEFILSNKDIKHKKSVEKDNLQRQGRWTSQQNLKYLVFLSYNLFKFQCKKKRMFRLYKPLSKFIQTRNSQQCRSHHRKLLQRFKTPKSIILNLEPQFNKIQIETLKQNNLMMLKQLKIPQKKSSNFDKSQSLCIKNEQNKANQNLETGLKEKGTQSNQEKIQIRSKNGQSEQLKKLNPNICMPGQMSLINYQALNWFNNLYISNYVHFLSELNFNQMSFFNNGWMNYNGNC